MCVLADVLLRHHLPKTCWSAVAVPRPQRPISLQRPRGSSWSWVTQIHFLCRCSKYCGLFLSEAICPAWSPPQTLPWPRTSLLRTGGLSGSWEGNSPWCSSPSAGMFAKGEAGLRSSCFCPLPLEPVPGCCTPCPNPGAAWKPSLLWKQSCSLLPSVNLSPETPGGCSQNRINGICWEHIPRTAVDDHGFKTLLTVDKAP